MRHPIEFSGKEYGEEKFAEFVETRAREWEEERTVTHKKPR